MAPHQQTTALVAVLTEYTKLSHLISFQFKEMSKIFTDQNALDKSESCRMLLHMAGVSSVTIGILCKDIGVGIRDSYGISRSILELSVNFSYALISEDGTISKLREHAEFLLLKNRKIDRSIGSWRIQLGTDDPHNDALESRLLELSEKFTTRKGHKKGWSTDSIYKKIEAIGGKFNKISLYYGGAAALSYEISSEYLHGSLYSALHFYGVQDKGHTQLRDGEFINTLHQHAQTNLIISILSLHGALSSFAEYVRSEPLVTQLNTLFQSLSALTEEQAG